MTHFGGRWRSVATAAGLLITAALVAAQPGSQTGSSAPTSAQPFLAARAQLDQTVWAPEVLAQHYERRFVQLWDLLLQGDDKYGALANFPFSTLRFGRPAGQDLFYLWLSS